MSASLNSRHGDDGSLTAQFVQSPSSMRFAAGASGFLTLIEQSAWPSDRASLRRSRPLGLSGYAGRLFSWVMYITDELS
jgi:hypothetical protein